MALRHLPPTARARDISQSGVASDASAIMERPGARGKRSLKREDETPLALVPTNHRFNRVRWYDSTLDGYYLPARILNCPFQLRRRKGAALRYPPPGPLHPDSRTGRRMG